MLLPAATGGGGLHAQGHDPRDGPQLQSVQAQQAADAERGSHDRETRKTAEDRAGEEAPAEAPGTQAGFRVPGGAGGPIRDSREPVVHAVQPQ